MTSCAIIISHYESLPFLRAAIRQIRKHENINVRQAIIIADQSCRNIHGQVVSEFGNDSDITISWMKGLMSGFGIDHVIRNCEIDTEYICQIHCDAFGISDKWLLLPITLIEENNLSFVGQLQFICNGTQSIYPPDPFFAMAQCFNVAKTETYREMSLEAGFTRFHNRPDSGLTFKNNDWALWAESDYQARGSDDDVVAFHWNGKYKTDDMLGLAVTGFIAPAYGRIIEDVVFHFGSCRESIGTGDAMGEEYKEFTRRINENYDDALIDEMVNLAKANRPPETTILTRNFWDGNLKVSSPPSEELNKRIEELKRFNSGCQITEYDIKTRFVQEVKVEPSILVDVTGMTDVEVQELWDDVNKNNKQDNENGME